LARAPALQAGGPGFESPSLHQFVLVLQLPQTKTFACLQLSASPALSVSRVPSSNGIKYKNKFARGFVNLRGNLKC
jgi:hypothetical protein